MTYHETPTRVRYSLEKVRFECDFCLKITVLYYIELRHNSWRIRDNHARNHRRTHLILTGLLGSRPVCLSIFMCVYIIHVDESVQVKPFGNRVYTVRV